MEAYFRSMKQRSQGGLVAAHSDLIIVAGVIAIIALMIIPLPTAIIDILLGVNITFGIILLLTAIYISSVIEFSVFPGILLISTLFRLAISVATTRLILLQGDAGQIIDTFGHTVAGGNLVVGLVVFLIITVVQFIVIAKGAERVAEVAARFSLDGMPGKQLSIDSDLRSGLIDKDEARRRRSELELESKLHGSLDGAMKFVKGDAIASLVIIVINLLGGLAVGVWQQNMAFGSALERYSILTIGDGLVAQIPALLSAMAAGLIVTRTADGNEHLGDSMVKQLSAKPRVLLVASAMCFGMAAIPGFPWPVFLVLGLTSLVIGALLTPALKARIETVTNPLRTRITRRPRQAPAVLGAPPPVVKPTVPLLLEVTPEHVGEADPERLVGALKALVEDIQLETGLGLPHLSIHLVQPDDGSHWRLLSYETPVASGRLEDDDERAPIEVMAAWLNAALKRNLTQFLGIQETSVLIGRANADYPDLVKEVLRSVPVPKLAEIMRRLVEEGVPLRNLRGLLEGIADAAQREKETGALTECARIALSRELNHRYAPNGNLRAILLDPELEEGLRRNAGEAAPDSQHFPLDPGFAKALIAQIGELYRNHDVEVLLTTIDLRRRVRKLIEPDLGGLAVLSYNELSAQLQLDIVGRVTVPGKETPQIAAAQ